MPLCQRRRVRIVFMGSDTFAVPTLEAVARTHEITAVVTQPDKPAGRARKLTASPVKIAAEKLGLQILQPVKARDAAFIADLRARAPDAFVVVAYGQILTKEILELPPKGCINVHSSLLPKYRGASPVAHAILAGEAVTGVTTMRMNEGLDTGPILLQREERISPDDTTASVEARLAKIGSELLLETLEKSPAPRPQDNRQSSYAKKLTKEDGKIDWMLPAEQIERRVRAFNPWPSAFTFHEGKRLQIWTARPLDEQNGVGIVARIDKDGVAVGTGTGTLFITELQREGGKRMPAAEFLRGCPMNVGDRFE